MARPRIRRTAPFALVIALAAGFSATAAADTVTLSNGNKLEGDARRDGDRVIVRTPGGEVTLEASEVQSIVEGETVFDRYLAKRKDAAADDAGAQAALAAWCLENGLRAEGRRHYQAVLEKEPDHESARAALGYVRHDGEWMTENEAKQAQGLVLIDGKWVARTDGGRTHGGEDPAAQRRALQAHARKIRSALALMSSHKRKTRAKGRVQLQEYAESIGDMQLAAFAGQAADWYNEQWRAYKTSLMKTEIRATMATLKRPIPKFQTSLGALTSPVTLQLPELSVVQVRTTALIPASEIELDD